MAADRIVRWGLIGPGRFAREFASELACVPGAHLAAVASRCQERAAAFASEFGFERSLGSYDALFDDDSIDVVYIVVPHCFHRELAQLAILSGKAVLCEKPLTLCAADTTALTQQARTSGVFLMEAMKTGFLPAIHQAKRWIDSGAIGTVQSLQASFCFPGSVDPDDRLMNPDLGGGCILDIGIYPLYLALHLLGEVDALHAIGRLATTLVEETVALTLQHQSGACSLLTASFRSAEEMDALILGTDGSIRIPCFHAATAAILQRTDGTREEFHDRVGGMVRGEIEAVHTALGAGQLECPGHPHRTSIRLAELMDAALAQVRPGP